jgi:hypothetical protein
MRTYWFRIVLGALGVFAVGMVVLTVARKAITGMRAVARSSDPITIPLALVPFRLDGDRLGTFDRAVLIRKSPHEVSAVDLTVKLGDSASASRLNGCALLARFNTKPKGDGAEFADADFTCVPPDSATAHGAEAFGGVAFQPGGLNLPLFVPVEVARHFHRHTIDLRTDDAADSISDAADRKADSIGEAASRLADSIGALPRHRADSARESAHRKADSIRRHARQLRDSIRAAVRHP